MESLFAADFGDYEKNSIINTRCSFCGSDIEGMPVHSMGGEFLFCVIVCAKLFNDNERSIEIDKGEYDRYFEDGLLSDSASDLYCLIRFSSFKCLPRCINYKFTPLQLKRNYAFVIKNTVR